MLLLLLLLLQSCFRKALDLAAAAKGKNRRTLRSSGPFFLLPVAAACVSELLLSFAGNLLGNLAVVVEGLQALAVADELLRLLSGVSEKQLLLVGSFINPVRNQLFSWKEIIWIGVCCFSRL